MSKVIKIEGCKDCPYNQWDSISGYTCENPNMEPIYFDGDGIDIPETPHPDCKLPDFPSEEDIQAINKEVQDMFIYPYITSDEATLVGQVYGFTMKKVKNLLNKINGS